MRRTWSAFVLAAALAGFAASPAAASIDVNSQTDDGSGGCTLREAVTAANNNGGGTSGCTDPEATWKFIYLPAGTYFLEGAPGEDGNATGDLDATEEVFLLGPSAIDEPGVATIDAPPNDRIIEGHTSGQAVGLTGMRLVNGDVSGSGGAVKAWAVDIRGSMIANNSAGTFGGAVRASQGLFVSASTFSGNVAGEDGGALELSGPYTTGIQYSTFVGNRTSELADSEGGAIDLYGGAKLILHSSTLTGNRAGAGGAIFAAASAGSPSEIDGVTIASNVDTVGGGGGGIEFTAPADVTVKRTILAHNVNANGPANCGGPLSAPPFTPVYNLESENTCGLNSQPLQSSQPNTDPQLAPLGPLGDYGGVQTMALYAGSPAIDAIPPSDCGPNAQNSASRPQGAGCDIGAFEGSIPKPNGSGETPPAGFATRPPVATPAPKKGCAKRKKKAGVAKTKKCRKRPKRSG